MPVHQLLKTTLATRAVDLKGGVLSNRHRAGCTCLAAVGEVKRAVVVEIENAEVRSLIYRDLAR